MLKREQIISSVDQTINNSFSEYTKSIELDLNLSKLATTLIRQQINETIVLQEKLNAIKVQLLA